MATTTTLIKARSKSQKRDPSSYKLIYFNAQWLGEPIRYLLCYEGEEFEDVRVDWDEWEKGNVDKSVYRFSKLPILEVKDAAPASSSILSLSQSFAILKYLGKKYNLVGRSLAEDAKCDEISDVLKDILKEIEEVLFTEDEKKMQELRAKILTLTIPRYFSVFEEDLKKGSGGKKTTLPLVGDNLTWLDFQFAHFSELFENFLKSKETKNVGGGLGDAEKLFDTYPMIREHRKWVFSLEGVKEWRESRPVTEY